jgi:thiamine-phosphate pyrophosphorylase
VIPNPCLALITDIDVAGGVDQLIHAVELAVIGGVQMVQIRANQLSTLEITNLTKKIRISLDGIGSKDADKALLFVNRHVDIAVSCGADGVHLSEDTPITKEIKATLANHSLLLGKSAHSLDSALQARIDGADLLIVGPIFETRSHPGVSPKGTALMHSVTEHINDIPILGIGGVNNSNIWKVVESGGHGAGLIRGVLEKNDPRSAAKLLRSSLERYWASSARSTIGG